MKYLVILPIKKYIKINATKIASHIGLANCEKYLSGINFSLQKEF